MLDINKPLILCLGGPSLKIFDDNIEFFKDKEVYFACEQMENIIEKRILTKINKYNQFYSSFWNGYDGSSYPSFLENARQRKDVYFFSFDNEGYAIKQFKEDEIKEFRDRIFITNHSNQCGIYLIIFPFIGLGFKNIFIFGMDGQLVNGKRYYINEYHAIKSSKGANSMEADIPKMETFWEFASNEFKEINTKIYNVCPTSKVECFQKVDFNQVKELI